MAEQIIRAEDNGVASDLGATNSQGQVNLATFDYDANASLETVISVLNSISTELQSKVESGEAIALDTATLNALESITASVSNFPTDYPDSAALTQLQATVSALSGTLDVAVQSPVALDAATLSALESITAVVSNWPTTFPDQHDQPLTDTQLRSAPVEITGTVNVSGGSSSSGGLTDAELRASPVETYEGPLIVSDEDSSLDQTLAAGETFLGPWVDALDAVDIRANIISYDEPLETELQWGSVADGIVRSTSSEIPAGVGTAFSFPVTARFYRVRVTNVGSGPTDVLSRVGLSRRASSLAQMAIATPIKDSSLAGLTRSVLTGKDNQGNYQNVRVNPQGRMAAEVSAHDIDNPTTTAFTSGHVDNGEVKATEGSGGRIYVADQHSQSLTDSELRAQPVDVTGTVNVSGGQTDALTDTELRAAPVDVNTGLAQPVQDGGNVNVSNHPADYPDATTQAKLDDVTTKLDSVATKLDALLTEMTAKTEPTDTQQVIGNVALTESEFFIGYTSDLFVRKVLPEGKGWLAGGFSGGSGTRFLSIKNPVDSGVNVVLFRFEIAAAANADVYFHNDPTATGTAQVAHNMNQMYDGLTNPVALVETGSGSPGGNLMSPVSRLAANITVGRDLVLLIPPGEGFAISASAPSLGSLDLYATAFWYEEAA